MAKRSKKRKRVAEKDYLDALHLCIDGLFEVAAKQYGLDWNALAEKSGVSRATVHNLGNRVTRFPEFRSVYLIAKAVNRSEDLVRVRKLLKKAA